MGGLEGVPPDICARSACVLNPLTCGRSPMAEGLTWGRSPCDFETFPKRRGTRRLGKNFFGTVHNLHKLRNSTSHSLNSANSAAPARPNTHKLAKNATTAPLPRPIEPYLRQKWRDSDDIRVGVTLFQAFSPLSPPLPHHSPALGVSLFLGNSKGASHSARPFPLPCDGWVRSRPNRLPCSRHGARLGRH